MMDPSKLTINNFDQATVADHEVAAAVTGERHRVVEVVLHAIGATDVTIKSGTTVLLGPYALSAGSFLHLPAERVVALDSRGYWAHTAKGEALNIALSAAQRVAGHVGYATTGD